MTTRVPGPYRKIESGSNWHKDQSGYYSTDHTRPTDYYAIYSNGDGAKTGAPSIVSENELKEAYNQAYARFAEQVKSAGNMAVNVATMNQTIDLVCDIAATTLDVIKILRNPAKNAGKFKQIKNRLGGKNLKDFNDTAAGIILAYQYGVKPLIDDVNKTLQHASDMYASSRRINARSKVTVKKTEDLGEALRRWDTTIFFRLSANVGVSNPSLFKVSSEGLTNPLEIFWEVVPFSFVIDWCVNVGDLIAAMDDFVGVTLSDAYVTKSERRYWSTYNYYCSTIVQCRTDTTERRCGNIPGPSLVFTSPFSGSERLLNQIALLVTGSKGHRI